MKVNNRYRPAYHASVPEAWSNDPNGMIYYKGRVHLFFQHYPHKAEWGPMHWGHFSTKDFIKWESHPVALIPDQNYEVICGCCSGNAVELDGKLWLMYTAAQPELQRQCLAWSDDGIHFTKLEDNPVLTADMLNKEVSPRDFRDPKIFRKDGYYYCLAGTRIIDPVLFALRVERLKNEEGGINPSNSMPDEVKEIEERDYDANPSMGGHYPSQIKVLGGDDRMALGNGNLILFKSEDLKHWEYCGKLLEKQDDLSEEYFTLDGVYECPDYFESNGMDIILASPQNLPQMGYRYQNIHSVVYLTGHLNFETGHFDISGIEDLDSGFDIYASQAVTMPDGRHIMIAWKEMWDRTYPTQVDNWVGTYTLPRELEYKKGHLYQSPVREIITYRKNPVKTGSRDIRDTSISIDGICGKTIELYAAFDPGDALKTGLKLFKGSKHETLLYYDAEKKVVVFDRTHSGVTLDKEGEGCRYCAIDQEETIRFHVFLDVCSVEAFINDGRFTMTSNVYPDPEDIGVEFFSQGGSAVLIEAEKYDIIV